MSKLIPVVVVGLAGYATYKYLTDKDLDLAGAEEDLSNRDDFGGPDPFRPEDGGGIPGNDGEGGSPGLDSDGQGRTPSPKPTDDGSHPNKSVYQVEFEFDSMNDFIMKLKELMEQGVNIQGYLNVGNSTLPDQIIKRLQQIREQIALGYSIGWESWGQDEFDKVNDFLRSVGFTGSFNRTNSSAILQQLASLESFITDVTVLVETAKSSPATVFGAPKITFDAYECSFEDWDTATMNIKVVPLTPAWDNMICFCPRHRIGQEETLRQRHYAAGYQVGARYAELTTGIKTSPDKWLEFMRQPLFNPNEKLALDAERGALAFKQLGYDLNLMSPRRFSLLSQNHQVQVGSGVNTYYNEGIRCDIVDGITTMKTHFMRIKGLELTIPNPTISKLKRFLGIGNIGNYDLFFLENKPEDTGEGYQVTHFRATSRSSDVTLQTHDYLFNEIEDTMTLSLYPQTYFTMGTAVNSHRGRFFMIRRIGMIAISGLKANNIQFIGEFQSGCVTPTLDYRILESNRGLILDVRGSTATESPLRAFDSLVLFTKEECELSFKIVEDERAIVIGAKKTIDFQETSGAEGEPPD